MVSEQYEAVSQQAREARERYDALLLRKDVDDSELSVAREEVAALERTRDTLESRLTGRRTPRARRRSESGGLRRAVIEVLSLVGVSIERDVARALCGAVSAVDLSARQLYDVLREDARHADRAFQEGELPARTLVVPTLSGTTLAPTRSQIALSSFPLDRRLVSGWSRRYFDAEASIALMTAADDALVDPSMVWPVTRRILRSVLPGPVGDDVAAARERVETALPSLRARHHDEVEHSVARLEALAAQDPRVTLFGAEEPKAVTGGGA